MPALKELRERAAENVKRMREINDKADAEKRDLTDEERQNFDKASDDYDAIAAQIDRAEKLERAEQRMSSRADRHDPDPGREDRTERPTGEVEDRHDPKKRDRAFRDWFRAGCGLSIDDDAVANLNEHRLSVRQKEIDFGSLNTRDVNDMARTMRLNHPTRRLDEAMSHAERRDMSGITLSAGGALVPEGFLRQLEINMLAFGGMMEVAEFIRTASGEDLPMPTVDDTSNEGEIIGEGVAANEADPSLGQIVFKAHKFSSKLVQVPFELTQDSAVDVGNLLAGLLATRIARHANNKFTTGTGSGEPRGLITAATLGVTAASATDFTADEILDLEHSVDPSYRNGARFMLHDSVLKVLRKKKDGEGRYLWSSGLRDGAPDSLLGYGVTINQHMASSVATTNKTIAFGDLSKYKIRQVASFRMRQLNERYADQDLIGFIAYLRQDGNLVDAGTAPVKYLQQA